MSIVTTRGQIPSLMRDGLHAVFGNYATLPAQYTEVFKTQNSGRAFEEDVEMEFTGFASLKPEGTPFATSGMQERVKTTIFNRCISIGFIISKEALNDNRYPTEFPQQVISLKHSMVATKDTFGAAVLNNAFDANFPIGDGQALCSTEHPIQGGAGTYSNTFDNEDVLVDFSEAGVEAALTKIRQMRGQNGILTQTKAQKLIVPPQLDFAASRLLNSAFRTDVATNDISAIYHGSYIPQGYRVFDYLLSPNAWFIITDAPMGMTHLVRESISTDAYQDMATKNIMISAEERYAFYCANGRGIFGSRGV